MNLDIAERPAEAEIMARRVWHSPSLRAKVVHTACSGAVGRICFAVTVHLLTAPAAADDRALDTNEWIKCDPSNSAIVHIIPPSDSGSILEVSCVTDDRGWSHLFWLQSNGERSIWHTAWDTTAKGLSARSRATKIAEGRDLEYGVTCGSQGIAVAWCNRAGRLFIKQWSASLGGWGGIVPGPALREDTHGRATAPIFFTDGRILIWHAYLPHRLDSQQIDELRKATPPPSSDPHTVPSLPYPVFARIHSSEPAVLITRLGPKNDPRWSPPRPLLTRKANALARFEGLAFERSPDTLDVFVETAPDGQEGAGIRHYTLPIAADPPIDPMLEGRWPLLSKVPQLRLMAVPHKKLFYLFCRGAEAQDGEDLLYSRSDTPGTFSVLARKRDFRCGPAVGAFRPDGDSHWGVVAWDEPDDNVAVTCLFQGKWFGPAKLPMVTTESFAVALTPDYRGCFLMTTEREIRCVPFILNLQPPAAAPCDPVRPESPARSTNH